MLTKSTNRLKRVYPFWFLLVREFTRVWVQENSWVSETGYRKKRFTKRHKIGFWKIGFLISISAVHSVSACWSRVHPLRRFSSSGVHRSLFYFGTVFHPRYLLRQFLLRLNSTSGPNSLHSANLIRESNQLQKRTRLLREILSISLQFLFGSTNCLLRVFFDFYFGFCVLRHSIYFGFCVLRHSVYFGTSSSSAPTSFVLRQLSFGRYFGVLVLSFG